MGCPPCRGFTPKLAEKYNEFAKSAKVEIVFVSSDQDEESFKDYYNDMPWLALPFDCTEKKTNLSTTFSVQGIPTLVVLDGAGKLVQKTDVGNWTIFSGPQGLKTKLLKVSSVWSEMPLSAAILQCRQRPRLKTKNTSCCTSPRIGVRLAKGLPHNWQKLTANTKTVAASKSSSFLQTEMRVVGRSISRKCHG